MGKEYVGTRHNIGRTMVMSWVIAQHGELVAAKRYSGLLWEGSVGGETVRAFVPECYMNQSGGPIGKIVTSKKQAATLMVVHDDLDLPLGTVRVAFARGAGGHNGVASIIKSLKTDAFVRIRVGISPSVRGVIKKPVDADHVHDWVLGMFSKKEQGILKDVEKKVHASLSHIVEKGVESAMNTYN